MMKRHLRRSTLKSISLIASMVATVLLAATTSGAQSSEEKVFPDFKWEPITEKDWNPKLDWLDEPTDAVMIFEKVIDDNRVLYYQIMNHRVYTRTRILTEKGQRESDISFIYYPKLDFIIELQARTVLRDGSIFELSKADILFFEKKIGEKGKSREVSFSFPRVDSDCIIEYCIGLKQKLENRIFTYVDRPIQKDIPLMLGEYTWFYAGPKGPEKNYIDLGYHQYAFSGGTQEMINSVHTQWDQNSITHIVQNVPAWHEEPMSLPESATRFQIWRYYGMDEPQIAFQKIADGYKQPEPYWYDFGKKDREAIHEATERFRGNGGQAEIVRAVYIWLQDSIANTSYYGNPPDWLTDKRGKKVKKFDNHKNLRDVLKKRHGNWMDIECLFYRMLTDLGIEAWPTLVASRNERIFNEKAGFYQFSRFIIAVLDSSDHYSYYSPGEFEMNVGKLHWTIEATDALLCDNFANPVRIPASQPESNEVVRVFSLDLNSDNLVEGRLMERHGGHKGRLCRVNAVSSKPEQVMELLADSLELLLPDAQGIVENVIIDSVARQPVEVQYSLQYKSQPTTGDSLTKVSPLLYAPTTENVFTSPKRYGEIVFRSAYRAIDTVYLSLGNQWQSVLLPADTAVVTDAGSCTVAFGVYNNRVVAVREFVLNKPRFSVAEYPELQRLFAAQERFSRLEVELSQRKQ